MTEERTPKVSVLVPCFNVERYVTQCLQSIACQTLNDMEVICINDGSTDSTPKLIRRIADNDSRFVVIDKPNSGYGASVNLALNRARGEYIGIVESDDFIEPDMFERLYAEASAYDLDISQCCYSRHTEGRDKPDPCKFLPKNETYRALDRLEAFQNPPAIWSAIYRRAFLNDNGIRFLETPGASFQDISFAFKTALMSRRSRCISKPLLHYRIHQSNSVKKASNPMVVIKEFDEALDYAKTRGLYEKVMPVMTAVEYASFKWNYLRLNSQSAHRFFDAWVDRWRKCRGYGVTLQTPKMYFYYVLITQTPKLFENYLAKKSK